MTSRNPYCPTRCASLLVVSLMLLFPSALHAQKTAEGVVRDWLAVQQSALSGVERITLRADMALSLTSGQTTRRIESRTLLSFEPGDTPDRTLEWLSVDGTRMPPESSDRYDARMRALLGDGPEGEMVIGNQAIGALLPGMLIRNLRLAQRIETRERGGEAYDVVTGRLERPGPPPGPLPGRMQGRRRPPPPLSATPPRHVVTLWFSQASGRLAFVEHRIAMPRGQGLLVRTRLERHGGLDIPVARTIEGDIPSIRRLRTVTLRLDHQITFRDHELTLIE
ncbi:MAG: hypothetical protein RIE53_11450 [Rhodothermales bacterium]